MGVGVYVYDLSTSDLAVGDQISFTIHWDHDDRWEDHDFTTTVSEALEGDEDE